MGLTSHSPKGLTSLKSLSKRSHKSQVTLQKISQVVIDSQVAWHAVASGRVTFEEGKSQEA